MNTQIKHVIVSLIFIVSLTLVMIGNILSPKQELSESERRPLKDFPTFGEEALFDSEYYASLEEYALDHFVFRDYFRTFNSLSRRRFLFQSDVNGLYMINDHVLRMDKPLNESSINHAGSLINKIIENYFKDENVYYGIIPNKSHLIDQGYGYPRIDYKTMANILSINIKDGHYIDLKDRFVLDDFFKTDHHMKQDRMLMLREKLLKEMKVSLPINTYEIYYEYNDFKGSYYGQVALPIEKDTISLLTNDIIETMNAYDLITGEEIDIYNIQALTDIDSYNVFLGGQGAIRKIVNPESVNKENLIVFGDSYSTALMPLLAEAYQSVTLIDLRFINYQILDEYIEFQNQDVLFLYSASILNDSYMLLS